MNKILVLSSSEGIRESLKLVLSNHHELILTESVEQCLEVAQHADIGKFIVCLDNDDKETLDVIGKIKSAHPAVKTIAVVSQNGDKIGKEAVLAGANEVIMKPIKADELLILCK